MTEKKRGALSTEEMNFIRQNVFDMTIEELAAAINRGPKPVKRFIDLENLKARKGSDGEHLLFALRNKYYFKELSKQLTRDEISFFEYQWVDYFRQFGEDVTHTEEMQIIEVIRTEILINRSMEDRQTIVRNIGELEALINAEMGKDEPDMVVVATFQTQLGSLIGSKGSYINEHEKLLTKKEKYLQALKGTREQRKKNAEDAKTNFNLWLKQLDDAEFRQTEGEFMEVHRVAADKARKNLSIPHKFADEAYDLPLLNEESYKESVEQENEE